MRFRVATLNLEQDHKRWEKRRDLVIEQLGAIKPDVLALNEVCMPLQDRALDQGCGQGTFRPRIQPRPADASERPLRGRGRGTPHAVPGDRDRQPRLPGARHRGARRPPRRRRERRGRVRDAPGRLGLQRFAASLPGAAAPGVDRQPGATPRRGSSAAISTRRSTCRLPR